MTRSPVAPFVPASICIDIPYPELIIWMFVSITDPDAAAVHQSPFPLMSNMPMPASPDPYWRMDVGPAKSTIWPLAL